MKQTSKEVINEGVVIEINNFSKKFKKFQAIKNISFNIKQGSIHGFIGPNGSGKTTTIKSIIGAYRSLPGQIKILNFKPGSEKANRLIGYIPEKASFPKHLNTIDYLITMATFSGIKLKEAKQKALDILKSIGLEQHKKRNPNEFSSGMKKKILLAQALIIDPKILILDEPAANLDPDARKELFDSLIELRKQGKSIFISSHILSELEKIIDSATFIYNGDVLFSGELKNISKSKNNLYIKTSNNLKTKKLLKEILKLESEGDSKSEIIIKDVNEKQKNEIIQIILENKIVLQSLRHNDLQSFYDSLVEQSQGERDDSNLQRSNAEIS
ncbi:ABC transporter ATP-binding protein [Metamycoplasma phocicerebrale]|uniref:ABC transporter ATP-binding protein n=1 Tax=Metamycoplasma phocicerebrale TaxID=142649 RepID=A0A3Q9VAE3_9BACT|nr:ABC transporter ATP-binding protein [Metamycoplasma phocicerebrale]AZZ65685.1 ABC transporter ATP-binding protein [Metamycoplasma phocicerebrale]